MLNQALGSERTCDGSGVLALGFHLMALACLRWNRSNSRPSRQTIVDTRRRVTIGSARQVCLHVGWGPLASKRVEARVRPVTKTQPGKREEEDVDGGRVRGAAL